MPHGLFHRNADAAIMRAGINLRHLADMATEDDM